MHRRPEREGMEIILYNNHVDRIRNMKSTIDNSKPKSHPLNNRKKK